MPSSGLHKSCSTRQLESEDDNEFLGSLPSPSPGSSSYSSLFPCHLEGLFFSPVIEGSENIAPGAADDDSPNNNLLSVVPTTVSVTSLQAEDVSMAAPRGLFRSPSAPLSGRPRLSRLFSGSTGEGLIRRRNSQKRSESDRDLTDSSSGATPVETKRQRSGNDAETEIANAATRPRRPFVRCHSETELLIKSALSRTDTHPDLIGDFSRPYCLPLIAGKHPDLKAISPDTVRDTVSAAFLSGRWTSKLKYSDRI